MLGSNHESYNFYRIQRIARTLAFLLMRPVLSEHVQQQHEGDRIITIPCKVCIGEGESVGFPEKIVKVPTVGEYSCSQLDIFLPSFYPDETHPTCRTIQSVGALCGCPVQPNACSLCLRNEVMVFPDRPLEFFSDMFGGISPTCELLGAYLQSLSGKSDICSPARSYLASYCGCDGAEEEEVEVDDAPPCSLCSDGSNITLPDKNISIEAFPFQNCKQLNQAVSTLFSENSEECGLFQSISTLCGCPAIKKNSCNMCRDGSSVPLPDKPARFLKNFFDGMTPTCEVFEAYAHSLDASGPECEIIQLTSGFCGCPPINENHCRLCDEGLKLEDEEKTIEDRYLPYLGLDQFDLPITCELALAVQFQLETDNPLCLIAEERRDVCGCNNGEWDALGANTKWKKILLAWLPRVSGTLSLIGASIIILHVGRDKKARSQMYNQLVAAMSVFDALSSIAWIASTAANDANDIWPVYGERGTAMTCKVQGFFVQLAVTSILYNVSLTLYYFLTIVRGWHRTKLKRQSKYLHIIPIGIGFGLAFAGIPHYDSIFVACHLPPPPLTDSWAPLTWLLVVPVFVAITFCTILMALVWHTVHKQAGSVSKWRFRAQNTMVQSQHFGPIGDITTSNNGRNLDMCANSTASRQTKPGMGDDTTIQEGRWSNTSANSTVSDQKQQFKSFMGDDTTSNEGRWGDMSENSVAPRPKKEPTMLVGDFPARHGGRQGSMSTESTASRQKQQSKLPLRDVATGMDGGPDHMSVTPTASNQKHQTKLSTFFRKKSTNMLRRVEREVIWQALSYLLAMYTCWILFTCVFYKSNLSALPYPIYCVGCFLMPLQGFLNFLIYSRPRAVRYWRQRRRRKEKNQRERAKRRGSNRLVAPSALTAAKDDEQVMGSTLPPSLYTLQRGASSQFESIPEPAAYLAESNYEQDASWHLEGTQPNLDVAEELAELEFAEELIEDFTG